MLAISVTLLFALYILGPDQVSRFLLGFSVTRRAITLTRSEEIARAVIWSIGPCLIALAWGWFHGPLRAEWQPSAWTAVLSGMMSDDWFKDHSAQWFIGLRSFAAFNASLLWRLYVVILLTCGVLSAIILNYAKVRHALRKYQKLRNILAELVLPRIAPWHLLLSRFLLHDEATQIHIDVLTVRDILYQGRLADKHLNPDGSLVSITLSDPLRFQREKFLDDVRAHKAEQEGKTPTQRKKSSTIEAHNKPKPDDYWKPIPTEFFVLLASEVHTLNVRYVPTTTTVRATADDQLRHLLDEVTASVKQLQKVAEEAAVMRSAQAE